MTLRYGFTGTHTQNVMVERIQALAVEQSILWRAFGWYRIKMTIAGIGIEKNDNQKLVTRNVALPVGNKQETLMVLRLLLPALDEGQAQVLLDTADGSLKSQKPQVPAMIVTPSSARWMDLLTWKRNGVTTVGYTAGSVQATTRIDSDAARSSVGEHTRGDLLLIRGGYFIRTLSIVPVSRVLSVSRGQGRCSVPRMRERAFRYGARPGAHAHDAPTAARLRGFGVVDDGSVGGYRALLSRTGTRAGFCACCERVQRERVRSALTRRVSGQQNCRLRPCRQCSSLHRRQGLRKRENILKAVIQHSKPARLGIGIISAGRVGSVLGAALRACEHTIVGVHAVSEASQERAAMLLPDVPLLSVEQIAERSELLILAVPDDELPGLVTYLASSGSITAGQILVHTSGRHGTEVLAPATALGAIGLAIHPAMTFTGMSMDLQRLNGTCFAVTGPAPFIPIAQALVVEMGGEPVHVAEADRALYHAALAHAANHLVTILGQSQQMLASIGIEDPARYMGPLVRAAVDNALASGEGALTGPVARGDAGTVKAHLQALNEYSEHEKTGDITDSYAALAHATAKRAHNRGLLNDEQLGRIENLLGESSDRNHPGDIDDSAPENKEFSS